MYLRKSLIDVESFNIEVGIFDIVWLEENLSVKLQTLAGWSQLIPNLW